MKPILEIQNLSKQFKIGNKQQTYLSLRDLLANPFKSNKQNTETFFALKDVNFEVNQGDSIGIIGKNGAGKSTLLKILSKITPPTTGKIISRGRIASLLEVGTGFHPELSGRENIFMNGSILGMSRHEIKKHLNDIIEFSGIEKFLDTPLKRYSSGMQLRLAFSVAAHLEPEILIIDEVLAVGDAEFQKKCIGKMDEVCKSGRTILFVSHDMNAVEKLCSKAILLQNGTVAKYSTTNEIITTYLAESKNMSKANIRLVDDVFLEKLSFNSSNICSGDDLSFNITIAYKENEAPQLNDLCLLIYSSRGIRVAVADLRPYFSHVSVAEKTLSLNGIITNLNLVEDDYAIGLFYGINNKHNEVLDISQITVRPNFSNDKTNPYQSKFRGFVELKNNIKIQ